MLATSAALVAAGAALLAVVVGVLNVVLTARLTAKRELDAWRRGVVYPLVAAVHAASYRHSASARALASARRVGADGEEIRRLQDEAYAAYRAVSDRLAELEVAAPEMSRAQRRLRVAHAGLPMFEDSLEQDETVSGDVLTARRELLAAAHAVLGVETKRRWWWSRIRRWRPLSALRGPASRRP